MDMYRLERNLSKGKKGEVYSLNEIMDLIKYHNQLNKQQLKIKISYITNHVCIIGGGIIATCLKEDKEIIGGLVNAHAKEDNKEDNDILNLIEDLDRLSEAIEEYRVDPHKQNLKKLFKQWAVLSNYIPEMI